MTTDHTPPAELAVPSDWIDGHPQLEAIAAAVWEQCDTSGGYSIVTDDPRNIAVAALGALAAVLPPPVSRAAEERIEQAEADAELHARTTETVARERETYRQAWKEAQRMRAKAEAEVRRLRTDRAAILADPERKFLRFALDLAADEMASRGDEFGSDDDAALASLRRMADETQPADRAAVLPAWEAVYEPGNVSDYLIGYAHDQDAATGMAEAWLRSQAEVTGRLEWAPWGTVTPLPSGYDQWFELVERHADGVDTGPGIIVRRRMSGEAGCRRCGHRTCMGNGRRCGVVRTLDTGVVTPPCQCTGPTAERQDGAQP